MTESSISLKNISYTYPSGIKALSSIQLELTKGAKIALLGGNGAGKSTLMFLLNGILKPTEGNLYYENQKYSYKRKALSTLRSNVGFLFQDSDNQLIAPTVYEEISFGLNNLSADKNWVIKKVDEAIEYFCLQELKDRAPHELSAGQKKRVCLASILAMEPEVLVCDEPTSNLDSKHVNITFNYLNNLHKQGKTILISTHDVNLAYEWADYVVLLHKGEILCVGAPTEVFANTGLVEKAGLNVPFIVETVLSVFSEMQTIDFPRNIVEMKKLINRTLCTDF